VLQLLVLCCQSLVLPLEGSHFLFYRRYGLFELLPVLQLRPHLAQLLLQQSLLGRNRFHSQACFLQVLLELVAANLQLLVGLLCGGSLGLFLLQAQDQQAQFLLFAGAEVLEAHLLLGLLHLKGLIM
jgi:hypothetical protein